MLVFLRPLTVRPDRRSMGKKVKINVFSLANQTDRSVCNWLMSKIREKILEAAGDLFQRKGYACVGVNEIIETAGVSKAGFYQNFESKENLCVEWLRETHSRSEFRHAQLMESDLPPVERVVSYFEGLADYLTCRDFRGCPFSNTASVTDAENDRIRREIESHKIFLREFFIDLADQCGAGEEAENLGSHLFLLYSGAATESQNLRSVSPVRTAVAIARGLCEGIGSPGPDHARKKALLAV